MYIGSYFISVLERTPMRKERNNCNFEKIIKKNKLVNSGNNYKTKKRCAKKIKTVENRPILTDVLVKSYSGKR